MSWKYDLRKERQERKSIEITLNLRGLSEIKLKVFVPYELDYVLLTVEDRKVTDENRI